MNENEVLQHFLYMKYGENCFIKKGESVEIWQQTRTRGSQFKDKLSLKELEEALVQSEKELIEQEEKREAKNLEKALLEKEIKELKEEALKRGFSNLPVQILWQLKEDNWSSDFEEE